MVGFWGGPSCGLPTAHFLLYLHVVGRDQIGSPASSYKSTIPIYQGPTLMARSPPEGLASKYHIGD